MDNNRMKHSLAVALKMVEIGKKKNVNYKELEDLFLLGYNHDIGYEFGNNSNHNVIGGKILKKNGFKHWKEVFYHGIPNTEYHSIYLDILNEADMQIDKFGNDVGFDKRLEDIKNRYGEKSKTYMDSKELIKKLRSENNG